MSMHVFKRGVFDVDHRVVTRLEFCARGFDPAGQFGDFALRLLNLCLRFLYLCIQVRHQSLLLINMLRYI